MKIAVLSDTHLTVPEVYSNSLFPGYLGGLSMLGAEELYHSLRLGIEDAYRSVLKDIKSSSTDVIIHLGDVVGGYREQGCFHPSAQKLAMQIKDDLESIAPTYFALGNHDIGYPGVIEGSGIIPKSLEVCERVYGSLWWKLHVDGLLIIGVCSGLVDYNGLDEAIWRKVWDQGNFLSRSLKEWQGPWALAAHSPFFPITYAQEIRPHVDRLHAFLFGDWHSAIWGRILRVLIFPSIVPGGVLRVWAACMKKAAPCPSVAPLWARGHRYLDLNIEGGRISGDQFNLPAAYLPTQNWIRCLWWMLQARLP